MTENPGPLSPQEALDRMKATMDQPHVIAEMDQRRAALHANLNQGLMWAGLDMLAEERGNEVAQLAAIGTLKAMLGSLYPQDLIVLTVFLLQERIAMEAFFNHDSDIVAALADWFGDQFFLAEKFVATDGMACPTCGVDVDHDHDSGEPDESIEG